MSYARLSLLLCSLLALVVLFSCQSSGPANQHKLLIYTPHGQDMLRDFVARYKQAHPEVEIQFLDMGSREVLERLRAERNRPQAEQGNDWLRYWDTNIRGRGK